MPNSIINLNDKLKLKENEIIFCPSHGVGKIISNEEKDYLGTKIKFCNIFFERENMNIMIPVVRMKEMGYRPITAKNTVLKVISGILKNPPKIGKGIWTKRIVECETKLYSGSILFIAEVVRDLFPGTRDANRSYSERALFDKAFNRMIEEFSYSLSVTIEEAHKISIEALMISSPITSNINNDFEEIENNKNSEGDFDDSEISLDNLSDDEDGDSKSKKKIA